MINLDQLTWCIIIMARMYPNKFFPSLYSILNWNTFKCFFVNFRYSKIVLNVGCRKKLVKHFLCRIPFKLGENKLKIKDAGFVYESLRIDTKRTFLTFFSYETNPRNKSFENCVTKRIHKTNLLNTVVRNESTKWIFWTP